MKKNKLNLLLTLGLLLYSITHIISHGFGIPFSFNEFLSGAGCSLIIIGAFKEQGLIKK